MIPYILPLIDTPEPYNYKFQSNEDCSNQICAPRIKSETEAARNKADRPKIVADADHRHEAFPVGGPLPVLIYSTRCGAERLPALFYLIRRGAERPLALFFSTRRRAAARAVLFNEARPAALFFSTRLFFVLLLKIDARKD